MAQFPFTSLRSWLDFLDEKGGLIHNKTEVDLRGDVSAIARKLSQVGSKTGSSPAIIHENVRGYPGWRVATSTLNTYEQLAWAIGEETADNVLGVMAPLLDLRVPPMQVSTGPCKELKMLGDEVDLTKLPHPFTGAYDGIPNITAGMSNKRDLDTGWQNIAIRRLAVKSKNIMAEFINQANQDFRIWGTYRRAKKKMDVAYIIGPDPVCYLVSGTKAPAGLCEYDLWGAFTGMPLEVVKCETNDLLVPANAEIIIEGEIEPEERELDGPFPEWVGYYSPLAQVARVKVTAITMRKDPIYYFMNMGWLPTEGESMGGFMTSANIFQELLKMFGKAVMDVYAISWNIIVIKVDKKIAKGWGGGPMAHHVGMVSKYMVAPYLKMVIVVDDDVDDIHDLVGVFNALMSKYEAGEDTIIVKRSTGTLLDPSEPWSGRAGRWGWQDFSIMDCTEKVAPWDEGYLRGKAVPPKWAEEKIEKNLEKYGLGNLNIK
jgi:UbiD family decarboxylase